MKNGPRRSTFLGGAAPARENKNAQARDCAEEATMEFGSGRRGSCGKAMRKQSARDTCGRRREGNASGVALGAERLAQLPAGGRESVARRRGEYDARRLRSQREVIRDVMLSAADCNTWLTLDELRALTRYGEASISAQLRHLRKTENGGYDVAKRHRDGAASAHPGTDGRGEFLWEYRMSRVTRAEEISRSSGGLNMP